VASTRASAVARTARRIDAQEVTTLHAYVSQIEATMRTAQFPGMASADMAFHRLLIVLSGNRAILHAWEPLAPRIETILGIANAAYADVPRIIEGHSAIARALEQHDAGQAEHLLREHLANGERLIHQVIRSVREESSAREATEGRATL